MTYLIKNFRRLKLGVLFLRPVDTIPDKHHSLSKRLKVFSSGLSFKLALLIVILVAITAGAISLVVISITNDVLLQSMFKRGSAISLAVASPAGFSIMAEDRLALDNLVAQISYSQPDLDYITIIDTDNRIIAHSRLGLTGYLFRHDNGMLIDNNLGLNVRKISRDDVWTYEFIVPINFSGNQIGYVVTGLNASSLDTARALARNKIIFIITLLFPLAISGAYLLSRRFTYPIEQLAKGVTGIQSGDDHVIVPVTANDELADLTRNFNEMSKKIIAQRRSLVNYSEELENSYADIVRILAAALDARDNYTFGHSSRVARLSVALGKKLQLKPYELKDLEMACMLHDIGKIRIPDAILNKPEKLTDEEFQFIKEHPYHGTHILDMSDSLKKYIPAVLHHHEWHDGSGYPDNLSGDDIPLYARIISITDAYDAMTSSRPYRQGLTRYDAIEELNRFKGSQFKPELVGLFIDSLDEYADVCDLPLAGGIAC